MNSKSNRLVTNNALHQLTIQQALAKLKNQEITSVELTQSVLDRIIGVDNQIRAYISLQPEAALEMAQAADERRAKGEDAPLLGIPIAVKDSIITKGVATTCGSKILENFVPPYDATVIEKLRQAGAVILGKTNTDEFTMGSSTEYSAFFPTSNPWNLDAVPGGSSGGSAAAVAADESIAALGTDTGGSVRQPAALCGVVGLKPTYGRVSRYGLVAHGSSLDQVGPLTKSAADAAIMLGVIAGRDRRDATTLDAPTPNYLAELERSQGFKELKIGVPREYFIEGMNPAVEEAARDALKLAEAEGAELVDISLPHTEYGIPVYYLIATAEASSNLSRYDGVRYGLRVPSDDLSTTLKTGLSTTLKTGLSTTLKTGLSTTLKPRTEPFGKLRRDPAEVTGMWQTFFETRAAGFGPEVKRRIMLGTYALSAGYYDAYYLKAQKARTLLRRDFEAAFQLVDVIFTPAAPDVAFKKGQKVDDPLQMYLSDIFTVVANLAGICGISVPCGFSDGLPIGLQILGPALGESAILQAAHAYEQATEWHKQRPMA